MATTGQLRSRVSALQRAVASFKREVQGMQEQLDRAVASGKLQGAGAGEGGVQFPLGAAVMQALAQCGDVGRDTAQRARWS